MAINFLDPAQRKRVIEEIEHEDNISRKREAQRTFDCYRDRQDRYIREKLEKEFDKATVEQMRKVLSLNLSKRIVDEMASVYTHEPKRMFLNVTDSQNKHLENIYKWSQVDTKMRIANRWFKAHDQCTIQVLPFEGYLELRVLQPHMYDVIPDDNNPEKASAYIISAFDLDFHKSYRTGTSGNNRSYYNNDRINQSVADDNDRDGIKSKYIVWTPEYHFTMDGKGDLLSDIITNPIGRLPFIDVAVDKDFQFFVRRGSSITEFTLDFGLMISDLANIARLQGYSQAIVFSEEQPKDLVIGPNHVLHIPLDPNRPELNPRFEFASPTPDLQGGLSILETMLRSFLSSRGIDVTTIATDATQNQTFTSGVDRLLAMLDKFEATRSDFDLFRHVENELLDLIVAWNNTLQGVSVENGGLVPEMQVSLPDSAEVNIDFHRPEALESTKEKLENIEKRLDLGLITRLEAIMLDRDVDEIEAEKIIEQMELNTINQNDDDESVNEDVQGMDDEDMNGEDRRTEA